MVRMIMIMGVVLAPLGCSTEDDDDNPTPVASAGEGTTTTGAMASSTTEVELTVCQRFEACTRACGDIELGDQTEVVRRDCLVLCPEPQFGMNEASVEQWAETCAGLFPPEGGTSTGAGSSGSTSGDATSSSTGTTGQAVLGDGRDLVVDGMSSFDEPTCEEWTVACQSFEDAAQG